MAGQKDSNPNVAGGKGGRKSERDVDQFNVKNNDGRIGGGKYNKQNDAVADGGPGMPQRKASKDGCKPTERPNDDLKPLDGEREGLETGAY